MWITQCVGYRNHKVFFLFTLYATLASMSGFIITSVRVYVITFYVVEDESSMLSLFIPYLFVAVTFVVTGATSMFTGGVCMEQFMCIVCNFMRIEIPFVTAWTKAYDRYQADGGKAVFAWPYFIGYVDSFRQVMGRHPLIWFLPITDFPPGEGSAFPLHPDFVKELQLRAQEEADASHASVGVVKGTHSASTSSTFGTGEYVSVPIDEDYSKSQ